MTGRIEKFAFGAGPHRGDGPGALHVGLVNNMPDAALRATELQFAHLLKEAAGRYDVRLHLFSMAQIPRSEAALSRMEGFYADVDTMPMAGLDALIVTGNEPLAADMRDEPYWDALAHVVDWAEIGTISTIFSCLAAHAAVLHIDNIVRRPLARKLSGIFPIHQVGDDPLLAGHAHNQAATPHSRRNEIAAEDLLGHNYRIITKLADGGVDMFARQTQSLFLFLQGHPEYAPEALGRDYCRDVGRWLRGEDAMPAIPQNYFDAASEAALRELSEGADARDLARFQDIVTAAAPRFPWRGHTLRLFSNWLALVAAEKSRRVSRHAPSRSRLSA